LARTSNNPRIVTRNVRTKLTPRRDPYWHLIAEGQHVGYRRMEIGGTWIARHYSPERGRRFKSLGATDDDSPADGVAVLTFVQAVEASQAWFKSLAHLDAGEVHTGPYCVAQLMSDYLADRKRETRKDLSRTRSVIDVHILPILGTVEVAKLTHSRVKAWRDEIADAAPKVRVKKGDAPKTRTIDSDDQSVMRKRYATANRIFTVLRAALNHGYRRNRIPTKAAWEKITPFRQVDAPKVSYLSLAECKRLMDACNDDFKALVQGALYTGARYGELIAMKVSAFDAETRTLHIAESKSGKPRNVALNDEGSALFQSIANGRDGSEYLFTHQSGRHKGEPWLSSQQRHWMEAACEKAEIVPAISFHILRHTYASQLAMKSTPMPVIAAQLGHADTRMTERHYAHIGQSYVSDMVRANLPSFGYTASS
jgi:integrase